MLLPAPGRPGLRRLSVRARPELPGGRGENPLRLARPQPVTSPFRRRGRGAGRMGKLRMRVEKGPVRGATRSRAVGAFGGPREHVGRATRGPALPPLSFL